MINVDGSSRFEVKCSRVFANEGRAIRLRAM